MVNMTSHHISEHLEIEEHWTEESTPQLECVKVIHYNGPQGIAADILPSDLDKTIETLQQIHSDQATQRTVKLRRGRKHGD